MKQKESIIGITNYHFLMQDEDIFNIKIKIDLFSFIYNTPTIFFLSLSFLTSCMAPDIKISI